MNRLTKFEFARRRSGGRIDPRSEATPKIVRSIHLSGKSVVCREHRAINVPRGCIRVGGTSMCLKLAAAVLAGILFTPPTLANAAAEPESRITILYDAFGSDAKMTKDWGFSALVEIAGKRTPFDTGNNAEIFAANVKAKGIDLTRLDFVVLSHRHSDHVGGLSYLLRVNPRVKIYAPTEGFGIFGSSLPASFYRKDESLPRQMRYYDGKPPDVMKFGTA